jgi:type I restriction enzyme, S subunit
MSSAQVPEGYKQTEIGVIPEDWDIKAVGDICDFIVPGRNKPKVFKGDIPWITTPDLENGRSVSESKLNLFVSRNEAKSVGSKIVPTGAVLMSCVGELGIVAFVEREIVINQQLHAFIPTNCIDPFFLLNALQAQKEYMLSIATLTAVPYLNKDNCNSILIPLPPLPEQQTIAEALSDVDALIASLDKLIAKQRQLKTAAMQQLLTGKMRSFGFGEGMGYKQTEVGLIPEDWEVYHLETLASQPIQNGVFTDPTRKGNGCKLINVGDLYSSIPINSEKLEFFDANQDEIKRFGVFQGDIFFTRSSLTPDGIAHCNIYTEAEANVVFDCHLIRFRPNANLISPQFFFRYCATAEARKYLVANSKTTTMTTIDQGVISKLPIPVPSLEEQHAIATVLSDMDTAIAALEIRRTKTQAIKQGMMQELLTGRTRLV